MSTLSLAWQLAKYLFLTIFVLVLAVGATRLWVRRLRPARPGGYLSLLEGLPLGPKQGVYLVRAADQVLVLGVTEANITLLGTISGAAVNATTPADPAGAPASGIGAWGTDIVQRWLLNLRKRGGAE